MIYLVQNDPPVLACSHRCRFCGGLVLVCEADRVVMHVEPKCARFAQYMASCGLGPGEYHRAMILDVTPTEDPRNLN